MTQYKENTRKYLNFDPRTKMILLAFCVFIAMLVPSLRYEWALIFLIFLYGCLCGKFKRAICWLGFFSLFYCLTLYILSLETGVIYTMFVAWMGLFYKVYPCGMLSGIILSTTKVNEFLTAMNKAHISKQIVIPLAVMLRYIPTIKEDWCYIKDAKRLRDVTPSVKGIIKNPVMTIECIYVPLMMVASKTADELSIAAVTRGIENPKPRTCLVRIKMKWIDWFIIALFISFFLLELFAKGGF